MLNIKTKLNVFMSKNRYQLKCKICMRKFTNYIALGIHIYKSYGSKTIDYYNKFLKKKKEGICKRKECLKKTSYRGLCDGYLVFCSHRCGLLYKHPNKNKKMPAVQKEKLRLVNLGKKASDETKKKMSEKRRGNKHWNWRGGISGKFYGIEFTNALKEKIRIRDKRTCQECSYPEKKLGYKLDVHHIDYNKKNSIETNLVSLCRSCHIKTNLNRNNWKVYFRNKPI